MSEKKELNIVGKRKIFFYLSSIIIVISIVLSFVFGVKMDIQFTGGSISQYSYYGEIDLQEFKSVIESTIEKQANVQETVDISTNKKNITVSIVSKNGISTDEQTKLNDALKEKFKDNQVNLENSNNVDASTGQDFFLKSIVAVLFAAIVIIIYIAFRFNRISGISAGVSAVIALLYDMIMVYATFIIFRIPLNDSFIAVILTILGYSINDTIVVYDRIRENKRLYAGKLSNEELVNKSINQSLKRSINTTISTVMTMVVVCVVSLLFGVNSIISFAFPIIIGMVSGVYSTLCIAGPLWVSWQNYKNNSKKIKKKVKKRKLSNI